MVRLCGMILNQNTEIVKKCLVELLDSKEEVVNRTFAGDDGRYEIETPENHVGKILVPNQQIEDLKIYVNFATVSPNASSWPHFNVVVKTEKIQKTIEERVVLLEKQVPELRASIEKQDIIFKKFLELLLALILKK